MAYYIYLKAERAPKGWELLEKVERAELAEEVYRNYKQTLGAPRNKVVAIVQARNLLEGMDLLNSLTEPEVLPPAIKG